LTQVSKILPEPNSFLFFILQAELLLSNYKAGDLISGAVCFEKGPVPILSLKPTLLEYAKTESYKSFEDLIEGTVLVRLDYFGASIGIFNKN